MDYAQNAGKSYTTGTSVGIATAEVPRTLSSAAGRLDALNERLSKATEGLGIIAGQLGALSGVNGGDAKAQPTPSGAVHRLNESADIAHAKLSEIEALIAGIGRALG